MTNNTDNIEHDLQTTMPQASQIFQKQLEDDLITRLKAKQSKEQDMTTLSMPSKQNKLWQLPITLVAAIIATVLVGGVIITMSQLPVFDTPAPYAAQIETDGETGEGLTSTVTDDYTTVYLAARDIAMGDTINESMIYETQWKVADVEALEDMGNLVSSRPIEALIGKEATTFIPRFSPIRNAQFVTPYACTNQVASLCESDRNAIIIQPNTVAVSLPISDMDRAATALRAGQQVDVIAAMLFVDIDGEFQEPIPDGTLPETEGMTPQVALNRVVNGATVLQVGTFPQDSDIATQAPNLANNDMIITLAVSPQDAEVLTFLAENKMPMVFTPTITASGGMSADEMNYRNQIENKTIATLSLGRANSTASLAVGREVHVLIDVPETNSDDTARLALSAEIQYVDDDIIILVIDNSDESWFTYIFENDLDYTIAIVGDDSVTKLLHTIDETALNADNLRQGDSYIIRFTFSGGEAIDIPATFVRVVEANEPDYSMIPAGRKTTEMLQFSTPTEWAHWFDYIRDGGLEYDIVEVSDTTNP